MVQTMEERNAKRRANHARKRAHVEAPTVQCERCGMTVAQWRKCPHQRWCRDCLAFQEREYSRKKRVGKRTVYEIKCVVCEADVKTTIPNQKSCDGCRQRFRYQRTQRRASLRMKTDPQFAAASLLRNRINNALAWFGCYKSSRFQDLVGCTKAELVAHIEKQFQPGMSWENRGLRGWHIDHILPCSRFDLTDPEQQKKCFHYTNLQPLWATENLRKSNKVESNHAVA
jgi:hypothetical protein